MALASNSPRMLVDRALASAEIDRRTFAAILTADVVTRPKPAPEIYLAACAALGTRARSARSCSRTRRPASPPRSPPAATRSPCRRSTGVDLAQAGADRRVARRARDHAGAWPVMPSGSACRLERGDHERDVLVEGDAQLVGGALELLAVDRGGERRLLELLAHRLGREAVDPLRAHHRAGDDEAAELVDGVERALHRRFARDAEIVGVGGDRADHLRRRVAALELGHDRARVAGRRRPCPGGARSRRRGAGR